MIKATIPWPVPLSFKLPKLHNPPKLTGGKAMTVALGFRCKNGIVLAADSEITGPTSKWSEEKIFQYPDLNSWPCFVYASDDIRFAKGSIERLAGCIKRAQEHGSDIISALRGERRKIHKEYCRLYPKKNERPGLDLLISLREHARVALYEIGETEVTAAPNEAYIGIGEAAARATAGPLYSDQMTTHEGMQLAAYTLMRAKEYSTCVGKKSQIIQAFDDGAGPSGFTGCTLVGQLEIAEVEKDFKFLQEALRPVLLGYYFGPFYAPHGVKDFASVLRKFSKDINARRRKRVLRAQRFNDRLWKAVRPILGGGNRAGFLDGRGFD